MKRISVPVGEWGEWVCGDAGYPPKGLLVHGLVSPVP